MGIVIPSRRSCCRNLEVEDVDHIICNGEFARQVWRVLCGPVGIFFSNTPFWHLLTLWWKKNSLNPVHTFIFKSLPTSACCELWRSRRGAKYGNERLSVARSVSLISYNIAQLINLQVCNVKITPNWECISNCSSVASNSRSLLWLSGSSLPVALSRLIQMVAVKRVCVEEVVLSEIARAMFYLPTPSIESLAQVIGLRLHHCYMVLNGVLIVNMST